MAQIELVRQEIERRKGYISVTHFAEELLSFLDILSEEPDKSLEKAAKEYADGIIRLEDVLMCKAAFIAGAEWQKEQDDKETADLLTIAHLQGMEQMKRQLLQGSPMPEDTVLFNKGVAEGRRLEREDMMKDGNVILAEEDFDAEKEKSMEWGYSLCKQQMMKDAVEGTVMDFSSNLPRPQVDILLDPHKYHTGDKVRIVVLKEEE